MTARIAHRGPFGAGQPVDWFALFLHLSGRIDRRAFWIGFPIAVVAFVLVDTLTSVVPGWLKLTLWAVFAYPVIAVVVKRLHDRGRSGWWSLLLAAPIGGSFVSAFGARLGGVGEAAIESAARGGFAVTASLVLALLVLELGLRPGDPSFSRFGPPPLP